jgi:imidazolonepropionase-like amidohydrolase
VATEVEHLIAAGLSAEAAVGAARWTVRAFPGPTGLTEGALADITVHDADPRREDAVLRHPRHIVLRGLVVR